MARFSRKRLPETTPRFQKLNFRTEHFTRPIRVEAKIVIGSSDTTAGSCNRQKVARKNEALIQRNSLRMDHAKNLNPP